MRKTPRDRQRLRKQPGNRSSHVLWRSRLNKRMSGRLDHVPELTFTIDVDHIPLADPVRDLDRRGTHTLWWSAQGDPDRQPPVHVPRTRTPRYLAWLTCRYDRDGRIEPDSWNATVVNDEQRKWRVDVIPANVAKAWEEQALYWAFLARIIRCLPASARPVAVQQAHEWTGTTGEFEMVMAQLFPT